MLGRRLLREPRRQAVHGVLPRMGAGGERRGIGGAAERRSEKNRGRPFVLFTAKDAQRCVEQTHEAGARGYATDGPFLWRTGEGRLKGLWAGFSGNGYTEGIAISENGEIDGRFRQLPPPFDRDGGHATVFNAFDGRIMMTLHSPNIHPLERPRFIELREKDGYLCRA